MKLFPSACFLVVLRFGSLAAEEVYFIDRVGEFPVAQSDDRIVVTTEHDKIQFRIRGTGPAAPVISKESKWFIAVLNKDHIFVHLGAGRLFYYSWDSKTHLRVDEWTYPNKGVAELPLELEKRLQKEVVGREAEPVPLDARTTVPKLLEALGNNPSFDDLTRILGESHVDIGSGIHVFVYRLDQGSSITVGTPDKKKVLYVDRGEKRLYPNKAESGPRD